MLPGYWLEGIENALPEPGTGATSVTGGALTSTIEYFGGVIVGAERTGTSIVRVVSGPSTIFVANIKLLNGATRATGGVCTTAGTIVSGNCPPSTATTEYVALLTKGCSGCVLPPRSGKEDPKQKREESAKRVGVEVLRNMVIGKRRTENWKIRYLRWETATMDEESPYRGSESYLYIYLRPSDGVGVQRGWDSWGWLVFCRKCEGWGQAPNHTTIKPLLHLQDSVLSLAPTSLQSTKHSNATHDRMVIALRAVGRGVVLLMDQIERKCTFRVAEPPSH